MTYPTIVEVIARSSQGKTRPFICRADDGLVYFVKGRYAGMRSLVCEWLAASLAKEFGLPIAPFAILSVSEDLVALGHAAGEPLSDLGVGEVFGSQRCEFSELTMVTADLVSTDVQADVAVFDWWIHNEDRTLTDNGGNPNLFWDAGDAKLWVVDHNLAFDTDFSPSRFMGTHVFSQGLRNAASDFIARTDYALRLSDALSAWSPAVAALPSTWHHVDPEQTIPLGMDFELMRTRLARCAFDDFWNLSQL